MTTYTTNFNFALPDFDKKPWHQDMADIVTTIDAVLARYVSANNMQGVWQNSTAYAVGERTVDEDDGTIWTCLVVHTSSPTGTTFAVARTTYPTYWEVFSDVELAKNWATYLAGTVDGSDYSSKAYAIGSLVQLPAGSAKIWATAAAADAASTAVDAASTAADVVSTNADVVSTNADVVTTNADVVTTTQDAIDTAADAVSTAADAATATAAAATVPPYDSITGEALNHVRLNAGETSMEFRTASETRTDLGLVIGTNVAALTGANAKVEHISIAVSDETTDLAVDTGVATFRMPYAFTLSDVRASVTTAPAGSVLTVDINESDATILSTKLTIDAGEKTSTTAAAAVVIDDADLADDAEITIDIDGVGSGTAGAGLKIYLIGKAA